MTVRTRKAFEFWQVDAFSDELEVSNMKYTALLWEMHPESMPE